MAWTSLRVRWLSTLALAVWPVLACDPGPARNEVNATRVATDGATTVSDAGQAERAAAAPDTGQSATTDCADIDAVTAKIYYAFVIHNEEDDANCSAGSEPGIPDYNGDSGVFAHYAQAMLDYAAMLGRHGAALSFQPDWTFVEGVTRFRPGFFDELRATGGNVEVVPHAHESCVPYDELFDRIAAAGGQPVKILGGMTFDAFRAKQGWFDANPGWAFWGVPTAYLGHVGDRSAPPIVYRIAQPSSVARIEDLYRHLASSPIIATGSLPGWPAAMLAAKPTGRYLTPAYDFKATRWFLAEASDTSVPPQWRLGGTGQQDSGLTAAQQIAATEQLIQSLQPMVDQGQVAYATVSQLLELFRRHEHCLDLQPDQDLSPLVENCRDGKTCPPTLPVCDSVTLFCLPGTVDGGLPQPPDGGLPPTCAAGCPTAAVCCPTGLPCQGQCVPDCRSAGCPPQAPTCDETDGVCRP